MQLKKKFSFYAYVDTLTDVIVSGVDNAPDVMCTACSFKKDSNARGCQIAVSEEDSDKLQLPLSSLTISRDVNTSSSIVLDCLTGLQGNNYRVAVREVKCDGKLANTTFLWPALSIIGQSIDPSGKIKF